MASPQQSLSCITLVVDDYDEAIDFYTRALQFELREDTDLGDGKRWVLVAPRGGSGSALLLAKAADATQREAVGNQSGGRVFLFLETNDFWRDYKTMQAEGVSFLETPRQEIYGTVAQFSDLYGNNWDLIERAS